ncbi:MAG: DUF512 domain-containing protein [Clostridiales bacterium]|nr:DUF512 domain-containing protein [Clostridiales bacterium]
MEKYEHLITDVRINSPADTAGIKPGDILLKIDDHEIQDVLDFHYYEVNEAVRLLIRHCNGEEEHILIDKDEDEEIGLEFSESLMDSYRSCYNNCVFCFIDQNPKGMRDTIYFKDDDSRLSFLQGNYITMTNLKEKDVERICYYHLSPINISIHTTNKKLRCEMLHNRFAGECLKYLDVFNKNNITMNGQIVLCKGINDGEELSNTIHDLTQYIPNMQSLSVVPVGLTAYREGLSNLLPFEKEDALKVLATIDYWQKICLENFGTRFCYASDEWYVLAGGEIPGEEYYEGYMQIENGVGMLRSLIEEVKEELEYAIPDDRIRNVSIATGEMAYPYICNLCNMVTKLYKNIKVNVYCIKNNFFGGRITVAGLLTGRDISEQLRNMELGEHLLLPENLLRQGEDVLLDDMTVDDIEKTLNIKVRIVKINGKSFVESIIE